MRTLFNKIADYIRVDGLLHLLVCYAIAISISIIDIIAALMCVIGISALKELYDLSFKRNTLKEAVHDLICDVIGIILAVGVFILVR